MDIHRVIEVYMTGIIGTIQQLETASSTGGAPTGVMTFASDGGTTYFRAMNLDQSGANTYDVGASSWGHAGSFNNGIGGPVINVDGIDPEEGGTTFTFTATTTLIATGATSFSWTTSTSGDTSAMGLSISSGGSGLVFSNLSASVSTTFSVTLDASNHTDSCNIVYALTARSSTGEKTSADSLTIRIRAFDF